MTCCLICLQDTERVNGGFYTCTNPECSRYGLVALRAQKLETYDNPQSKYLKQAIAHLSKKIYDKTKN